MNRNFFLTFIVIQGELLKRVRRLSAPNLQIQLVLCTLVLILTYLDPQTAKRLFTIRLFTICCRCNIINTLIAHLYSYHDIRNMIHVHD